MQPLQYDIKYLLDELCDLEQRIRLRIELQRRTKNKHSFDDFSGLILSEDDINDFLNTPFANLPDDHENDENSKAKPHTIINRMSCLIEEKSARNREPNRSSPLLKLAHSFQLTPFDRHVIIVSLAPEIDLRYEKLYAYLQNDVTRKQPTIDLAIRLFYRTTAEMVQAQSRFLKNAPLIKNHFVCATAMGNNAQSFLSKSLKLDERIRTYLLGLNDIDDQLAPFCHRAASQPKIDSLKWPNEIKGRLRILFSRISDSVSSNSAKKLCMVFYGPPGVGKEYTAQALCSMNDINLFVADTSQLIATDAPINQMIKRLFREAMLNDAALYLDNADALLREEEIAKRARNALLNEIISSRTIVILGSEKAWNIASPEEADIFINFELPAPDAQARQKLWQELLKSHEIVDILENQIKEIADKFRFTPRKIFQAFAEARQYAEMREGGDCKLSVCDLYCACRSQSHSNLASLAQKIIPIFTWNDIVLPNDTLAHLQEICLHVKYKRRVFEEWNFDQKISLGKGISVLFAGPPGTGKTMAAEIIANELGLDLYRIDLSTVVSKYIGETEKNLSKIFEAAEQNNAILFFDEADAIFGKRSEVKDSHDRYANIEINYLLQKMEDYEGIVILASNLQKNIDQAFTRRLRFAIDIPFPDKRDRYRIWQNIFPEKTPIGRDIEFEFLARKLEISGGHIKNIALNAAFLAANNSGVIDMKHIIHAAKREFQKMGRMCVKADFEDYFNLLETE